MRKKLWITLLTLVLCVGAFCVGAGAADDTQQPSSVAKSETSYATKYHDSLDEAFQWMLNEEGGTITLLQDMELTEQLRIDAVRINGRDNIVLDLGGHTLSANILQNEKPADSAVIYVEFATAMHFTIQNGTIENKADDGSAMYIADGQLTLKELTVRNDVVIQYKWLYYSDGDCAPRFFSGSFSRIRLDTNGQILLSKILGKGSYALMDGECLDKELQYDSLKDITFLPCDHKDDAGNYTFVDAVTAQGGPARRCTTCNNLCTHDNEDIVEDSSSPSGLKCGVCGLPMVACGSWEASLNSDYVHYIEYKRYFASFDDAAYSLHNDHWVIHRTITLLTDVTSNRSAYWTYATDGGFVIRLEGHTLTMAGRSTFNISGAGTFRNTTDTAGHFAGTIVVSEGSSGRTAKLTIPEEENNLVIDALDVRETAKKISLAGGSFGKITIADNKKLADLLASGYYFADADTGNPVALKDESGNAKLTLENVTVKSCSHDGSEARYDSSDGMWKCPCGQVTFAASVTVNGKTTYYTDMQVAFDAANGGTVKTLQRFVKGTVTIAQNVTLDLSVICSPYERQ